MITPELLSRLLTAAKDRPLLARIDPRQNRKDSRRQHHGRCRILSFSGKSAVIQPLGRHRKSEVVSLEYLRLWRSALPSDLLDLLKETNGNVR